MSKIIQISNAHYDNLMYRYELLQKLHDQTIKNHDLAIEQYEILMNNVVESYEKKLDTLGSYSDQYLRIKEIITTNKQLKKLNNVLSKKCDTLQEVNSEASNTIIKLEMEIDSAMLEKSAMVTDFNTKITKLKNRIEKLKLPKTM